MASNQEVQIRNMRWRQCIADAMTRVGDRHRALDLRVQGMANDILELKKFLARLLAGVTEEHPMEFYSTPQQPSFPPGPVALMRNRIHELELQGATLKNRAREPEGLIHAERPAYDVEGRTTSSSRARDDLQACS